MKNIGHMVHKGQMDDPAGLTMSAADQFYSLSLITKPTMRLRSAIYH